MSTAFGCKIPPYTTVIDLDRKVRDFPIPWRLRVKCGLEDEFQAPSVRLQRWIVMASKESSMCYAAPRPSTTKNTNTDIHVKLC